MEDTENTSPEPGADPPVTYAYAQPATASGAQAPGDED